MKKFLKSAGIIIVLLFLYSALQGLFSILAYVVAGVIAFISGQLSFEIDLHDETAMQQLMAALMNTDAAIWAIAAALFLSALVMLLIIFKMKLFTIRKNFFTAVSASGLLVSTALVFCSMLFLNGAVSLINEFYPIPDMMEEIFDGLSHNILGVLSIAVLAPILEEVLFRGAIQGYLMRTYSNPYIGMVVASLVFGIFHINPVQVIYASLLGFILGWIYYRTGSLLPVIIGHVLNNSIACISMLFFDDVEDELFVDENIAISVASVCLFGLLSMVLAFLLNRILPATARPWREVGEQPAERAAVDSEPTVTGLC